MSDLHASAAYRRRVAGVLCRRALQQARDNAAAKASERRAMKVELRINGVSRSADIEPRKTLLDLLRENFLLNGTHAGCEHGVCGACTVLLDGEPVRSCLMFAVQADGYEITTVEGAGAGAGRTQRDPGCVLRNPRPAMRLLHAGHDPVGARAAAA